MAGFAMEKEITWKTPDSVSIRLLGTYRDKGSTVPRKKLDSLKWLQDNVGLKTGAELDRVKKFCQAPQVHISHQVSPAHLVILLILENALQNSNTFVASLAAFAGLIVASVLRPKHLQRSVISIKDGVISRLMLRRKSWN